MAIGRCNVSSRDLFIFILCVAFLSVLLNFHVSYYGDRLFVDQRVEHDGIYSIQELREHTDRYDAKLQGRSLNQHEAESLRTRSIEGVNLRTKLAEIEAKLLKAKTRIIAAPPVDDKDADNAENELADQLQKLDIEIVKNQDALSWLDNDTVVQGNWTALFCFDATNCRQVSTDISQKVDRIPELANLIKQPETLCRASKMSESDSGQCVHFDCKTPLNDSTLLVSEDITVYNMSTKEPCKSGLRFPGAYVWHLPEKPMVFPSGPVLRLHSVISSMSPLRLYVHPEMKTASYAALENPGLFKKVTIEDLLQYISEVYGLGTSSRWWREVQIRLLLYFLYLEKELQKINWQPRQICKRCFQYLEIDLVCSSVHLCSILTVNNGHTDRSLSIMRNLKTLVTSDQRVSGDVEQILAQSGYNQVTELCNDKSGRSECLSGDYLMYLLDWRREIKSSSSWMPIYPSKFGCMELVNNIDISPEQSYTVQYNDLTKGLGDAFNWVDQSSTETQYLTDGDVDYSDWRLSKQRTNVKGTTEPCSNDPEDYGILDKVYINPEVKLEQTSANTYNATVGYDTILVRLLAVSKSCKCQVRLENKYNEPGPRNITLGLGETKVMLYVVDSTRQDLRIVNTLVVSINRQRRGLGVGEFNTRGVKLCALKQDCSLQFDETAKCGLSELADEGYMAKRQRCPSGDNEGRWVVPCRSCNDENNCVWEKAEWQADKCQYDQFSSTDIQHCLQGKKLLFIGDSTNRGVSNYIIEQVNGSLYEWDKTHTTRVYNNINNEKTQVTFAYYPHFWLPADHRPRFSKVIYQLIKSSLPLQNDSNTILVVGGVHWLAKQHIDLIVEALQKKGLSGITKVVKGLGAGFHQPVENVKFVPKSDHVHLQRRERDILDYAKTKRFHTVATFNMTISRYKDFLEGNCACHFHKVSKHGSPEHGYQYKVEGDMNAAYSQILLNQICSNS